MLTLVINVSLVSSTSNSTGHWSTDGCYKDEKLSNDQATVCHCTHLTHFAVLMRVADDDEVNTTNFKRDTCLKRSAW